MGRVKGLGPVKRNQQETAKDDRPDEQENNRSDNRRQGRGRGQQRNDLTGDPVEVNGMLEIAPKGFGFLRVPEKNFEQCKKDVFVPPDFIRTHGLRAGVWLKGLCQEGPRGPSL